LAHGVALPFPTKGVQPKSDLVMNHALKSGFPPFQNEQSLKSAIESVCAKFGKMAKLKIYPARRESGSGLRCPCFLRLDTSEAETELKSNLKVIEFADELAFFANVDEETWVGPRSL
jgi:hypothetical protein